MVKVKEDLTGKTFGNWKVIERVADKISKSGQARAAYLCECQCEKKTKKIVLAQNLKSGWSKSCGCLISKINSEKGEQRRKKNKYDLESFDYGVCYFNDGTYFIFDKEDYSKISKFTWFKDKNGYAVSSVKEKKTNKKHTYRAHRVILEIENREIEIDHKNREIWDNRKSNLRITNHRNNSYNRSIQKSNTSGFIGVSYEKKSGKWRAFLCRNKKYLLSKSFVLKEDAIKARLKAELEYYGIEYAPQRHLFKEYGII